MALVNRPEHKLLFSLSIFRKKNRDLLNAKYYSEFSLNAIEAVLMDELAPLVSTVKFEEFFELLSYQRKIFKLIFISF